MKDTILHKNYSVHLSHENPRLYEYSHGPIESVRIIFNNDFLENSVVVKYRSKEIFTWNSKYFGVYIDQFGVAVSSDGTKIFAQTWENGLFCFNAITGEILWRTKSKRGITSVFVNDNTVTAQLHEYATLLIDINTGDVIKEKRPSTAWGFTALDNRHIICRSTARKWELIESDTLNVKETFTHKEFTNGNVDFCINHISLCENGTICVRGFKSQWDDETTPPTRLPNIEFEYYVKSKILSDE